MMTSKDSLDLIKELSTSSFETARAFGELNLRIWEKMMTKQMDTFNLMLDTGLEQMKLGTETKDIKDLANSQTELAKKFSEAMVAKGREGMEVANEARDEYRALAEKSIDTFTNKVTEITKKAA